ncbi:hypothetical protein J6590_029812 [Homalodisca vitripennis]|nr:hypothetical protein J6590_029812 [Homalodisca vitripennis]
MFGFPASKRIPVHSATVSSPISWELWHIAGRHRGLVAPRNRRLLDTVLAASGLPLRKDDRKSHGKKMSSCLWPCISTGTFYRFDHFLRYTRCLKSHIRDLGAALRCEGPYRQLEIFARK